ncbi:MAG: aldo/keto reductase [Methanotrichaceae archaeon]|nr:aldo/keto reductase [Methanotrichaceae archaeon]
MSNSNNQIWGKSPVQRSLSEWALRWVWNHPKVTIVLSGISSMQQVEQNVAYAKNGLPGSQAHQSPLHRLQILHAVPSKVSILECFEMYNQGCMFDAPDVAGTN